MLGKLVIILWLAFLLGYLAMQKEPNKVEQPVQEEFAPSISVNAKPLGTFELTFYTHTGNRTASGIYPRAKRTIAVDTRIIPLGSLVYVKGYGILIAEDTGADIKGNRLDIFVNTKEEAVKLGRKQAEVYLLDRSIDGIQENLYNKDEDNSEGKGDKNNGTKATN